MDTADRRSRIAAEVRRRGIAPVARELGVSRAGLGSYLTETEQRGTRLLIEQGDDGRSPDTGGPRAA